MNNINYIEERGITLVKNVQSLILFGLFQKHKPLLCYLMCLGLVCSLVVSCSSTSSLPLQTVQLTSTLEPLPLILGPGDEIEVKFRYWPELNEIQAIRPDGKISLQLVDDVQAAGLTPEQLDEQLTKRYEGEIKDPVITVFVRNIVSQRVFVNGEVLTPGVLPLAGKMSVLQAVMLAGGFDLETAELSNVLLVQHMGDKRYVTSLDMKRALKDPESDQYYLSANDIVYVPRTRIANINRWMQQHITAMVPDTPINIQLDRQGVNHSQTIGITPRGSIIGN